MANRVPRQQREGVPDAATLDCRLARVPESEWDVGHELEDPGEEDRSQGELAYSARQSRRDVDLLGEEV
jgi:hypothetical protein